MYEKFQPYYGVVKSEWVSYNLFILYRAVVLFYLTKRKKCRMKHHLEKKKFYETIKDFL